MALAPQRAPLNTICRLCIDIPWFDLPAEFGGQAHHSSRSTLEASARTCPLCAMVLRAAIANLQPDDDKQSRWRYFQYAMVKRNPSDEDQTAQRLMIIRDLGTRCPAIHQEPDTIVMTDSDKDIKMVQDFVQRFLDLADGKATNPVIAHTFRYIDSKHKQPYRDTAKPEKDTSNRLSAVFSKLKRTSSKVVPAPQSTKSTLELQDTEMNLQHTDLNLPVWIYGNTWAEYNKDDVDDVSRSKKRVMGFGARFGTSHRIMDAVNNPPGIARLRGSFVQIYTDDGKKQ
jgi:hypothetical protein